MKEIEINHPALGTNKLVLQLPKFLGSPKLFFNGDAVEKEMGKYSLSKELGTNFEVRIRQLFYDAIPKLEINGDEVQLAKPLKWYEYAWMGFPTALILVGGVVGAILGILSIRINSIIFRTEEITFRKYAITFWINLGIITIYFLFSLLFTKLVMD